MTQFVDSKLIRFEKTESTNEKLDFRLSNFICFFFLCLFLTNSAFILERIIGVPQETVSNILKALIGIYFLFLIPTILQRINFKIIFLALFILFLFSFNFLLFPLLRDRLLKTFITFWTICFIPMISICCIRSHSILLKRLVFVSRFITYLAFIVVIIGLLEHSSDYGSVYYSMGFGYSCQLPALIIIKRAFDKPSLCSFLEFLIIIFSIVGIGSRGPLLGIAIFFLIEIIINMFQIKKRSKSRKFTIFLVVFIAFFFLLERPFLLIINTVLEGFGVRSRSIETILDSSFFSSSGREGIYSVIYNEITKSPFEIRGINSDYLIIGGYSHNLVLELIYQFGIVFGGIFIFIIILFAFRTLFHKCFDEKETIILMLFCSSVPSLMFSGSIWTDYMFWMWIGLSFMLLKDNINQHQRTSISLYKIKDY